MGNSWKPFAGAIQEASKLTTACKWESHQVLGSQDPKCCLTPSNYDVPALCGTGAAPVLSPARPGHGLLLEPPSLQSPAGTAASAQQRDLKIHLRILI